MGGKSRKSGGVSKKLIQALKSGKYSDNKCNSNKNESRGSYQSLFDLTRKTED